MHFNTLVLLSETSFAFVKHMLLKRQAQNTDTTLPKSQ